jgi:hypothetical protein
MTFFALSSFAPFASRFRWLPFPELQKNAFVIEQGATETNFSARVRALPNKPDLNKTKLFQLVLNRFDDERMRVSGRANRVSTVRSRYFSPSLVSTQQPLPVSTGMFIFALCRYLNCSSSCSISVKFIF